MLCQNCRNLLPRSAIDSSRAFFSLSNADVPDAGRISDKRNLDGGGRDALWDKAEREIKNSLDQGGTKRCSAVATLHENLSFGRKS